MINRNHSNYHVEYMDVTQHWCEHSEKFAGADALITAINDGWAINGNVEYETIYFADSRPQYVYYINLKRDDETLTMPVLHSPYLNRMISRKKFDLVERDQSSASVN